MVLQVWSRCAEVVHTHVVSGAVEVVQVRQAEHHLAMLLLTPVVLFGVDCHPAAVQLGLSVVNT